MEEVKYKIAYLGIDFLHLISDRPVGHINVFEVTRK
jgi:hypothetical protein